MLWQLILHLTHIHELRGRSLELYYSRNDTSSQTFSSRYSIDWKSDLDNYFDIDPVEGTISTNKLLDRESIAQHNISIVATKLSKYDNRTDRDSCEWHRPGPAIICVKDLKCFYSRQYSIQFCRKGLQVTINNHGAPKGVYLLRKLSPLLSGFHSIFIFNCLFF